MNFCHIKFLKIVLAFLLLPYSVACATDQKTTQFDRLNDPHCQAARLGGLDKNLIDKNSALRNSFLFSCAISVTIPGPKDTKDPHFRLLKKKQTLADHLLTRPMDATYLDENGNSLLMLVIMSFLSETWKESSIGQLLSSGVDIQQKNHFDQAALDFAKQKGNTRIVDMLVKIQ